MSTVIKVENISKQYRLGNVGLGSLSHDLNRWWYSVRGKEDPYLKIGEENDRSVKGESEYVWALRDINFEVKQGEVLGIIGRNGAGKSTLLKILSRTTTPTTGQIKIKGRVASLLEVGTGFHPELSGRENIFLNGAILGMSKKEIKSKLDEMIDFAGVERYIDTPVKRYSSGMYVRLAFAVAAHLDPEILIVDEVLAVGDMEFQKKALGKMKDVSQGQGRTVLFVSHNITAIKNLCTCGVILKNGIIEHIDHSIEKTIEKYYGSLSTQAVDIPINERVDRNGNGSVRINRFDHKMYNGQVIFNISYESAHLDKFKGRILIGIYDANENCVMFLDSFVVDSMPALFSKKGEIEIKLNDSACLVTGQYAVNIAFLINNEWVDHVEKALTLNINEIDFYKTGKELFHTPIIHIKQSWKFLNGNNEKI